MDSEGARLARGDGPALTTVDSAARAAVEAVWRIDAARIVGSLARFTGEFALAEDVAQEALAEALTSWSRSGVPDNPGAWLLTTARRRAIDAFRRRAGREERYAVMANELAARTWALHDDLLWDPDVVDDDLLALIFITCHPVLPKDARIALTLRTSGGLTTEEIAKALLISVPTVQARITRAKRRLASAGVPFAVLDRAERDDRLGSVLSVIYIIFTEGSSATTGDDWIRHDLAREALRLARVLVRLHPAAEAYGLLALLELTAARFPAREGPDGEPILLEAQDRRRWDASAIARGRVALERAVGPNGLGPYGLQAAIAECHAVASSVPDTDWQRIVLLYEALRRVTPSPVVELNYAVAVSMADGPQAGLAHVDALAAEGELDDFHHLHGVRGELLRRLGQHAEARDALLHAADLCSNLAERSVLIRKAEALS